MLKHYVEFSYPGAFFSEYSSEEIAERKAELVKVPEGAFAYRFYDREEGEVDGETLCGERKNYSSLCNNAYFATFFFILNPLSFFI